MHVQINNNDNNNKEKVNPKGSSLGLEPRSAQEGYRFEIVLPDWSYGEFTWAQRN